MKIPAKYLSESLVRSSVKTYQTDDPGNSVRKRAEDVDGWRQPLRQSGIATARFVKFLDLILKDGDDGVGRLAGLKLGCKRMCEKVILGLLLVGLQRCFEDCLET